MESEIINFLAQGAAQIGNTWLSVIMFVMCYVALLSLWKIWGSQGLYMYSILAITITNIQVLKSVSFAWLTEPVALGTVLFATTFTATDILTEYGKQGEAKQCIKMCFVAQIMVTVFMLVTVLFPVYGGLSGYSDGQVVNPVQYSMNVLFAPSLRITIASLISYYVSQSLDVYVFKLVAKMTGGKMMWLRFNVASLVSGLCDNVIFSTLAWVILSPNPVSFKSLVFTYIFGTYLGRFAVSAASTPVMYGASLIYNKNTNKARH